MGWASGSRLLADVIESVESAVSITHEDKVQVFKYIITDFYNFDCDTMDECLGKSLAFDEAYLKEDYEEEQNDESS